MDAAAKSLLQGIKLSPIPTCSCAKGLAVGIRMVQSCMPVLKQLPGVATGAASSEALTGAVDMGPLLKTWTQPDPQPSMGSSTAQHSSRPQHATAPVESTPFQPSIPDADVSSQGMAPARDQLWMSRLMMSGQ